MTATVWQRTPEWEPDPAQPREQLLSIVIDTARNGQPILLINDDQVDSLLTGAALRSNSDLEEAMDQIASQLTYAIRAHMDKVNNPKSRLINRSGAQKRW